MTETNNTARQADQAKSRLAKTIWRMLGILLSAVAFVYIAYALFVSGASIASLLSSPALILIILLGGLFYGLTLQFVGAGWWQTLISLGDRTLDLPSALSIFGRTQIFKYLPTNILHMAGRISEASMRGVPTTTLFVAQLLELLLLASAAALVSSAFGLRMINQQAHQLPISLLTILCMVALIGAMGVTALKLARHRSPFSEIQISKTNVTLALLSYSCFFVLNGVLLKLLSFTVGGLDINVVQLIGIGAMAWLVGFVVPGAPGGLGVREAAMAASLGALGVPGPAALALAISHRISTILGDCLVAVFFLSFRK